MRKLTIPKSLYSGNSHLVNLILWDGKSVMRQLHDTDATLALPKGMTWCKVGSMQEHDNGLVSITAY